MTEGIDPVQDRQWQILHDRITETLDHFGRKDPFGKGDYWLVDDNWGQYRHRLEIQNPALLLPHVIKSLQSLLVGYPKWEIWTGVYIAGRQWPAAGMGLLIYEDEIVDELQRRYLPPEFGDLRYEGSRRVFDRD